MFGIFKKKAEEPKILKATQNGKSVDITTLPDPVFAEKMLGDGFAILPSDGTVVAPVDGTIIDVQDSLHAYGISTEDGLELLVHIGINTVALNGEGFNCHVKVGDKVKAGDVLAEADLSLMKEKGYETYTITLITNMDMVKDLQVRYVDTVRGETPVLEYSLS